MVDEQVIYFYPYSNICRTQKIPEKYDLTILNKNIRRTGRKGAQIMQAIRVSGSPVPSRPRRGSTIPGEAGNRPSGEQPGYDRKSHHTVRSCPGSLEISVYIRVFNHNLHGIALWFQDTIRHTVVIQHAEVLQAVEQRSTRKRPGVLNAGQKLKQGPENSRRPELQGGGGKDS